MDKIDKFLWVENWLIDNSFYRWHEDIKHFGNLHNRIRKAAIVLNDNCLWMYRKQKDPGTEFKYYNLDNAPCFKDCADILVDYYDKFNGNTQYNKFMVIYANGRGKRITGYDNPRYHRLNDTFTKIIEKTACMKCGSLDQIQLDHIHNHYNFKDESKVYDLTNLQWLCGSCNTTKSEDSSEDYRTAEQKTRINEYINRELNGNNIIE